MGETSVNDHVERLRRQGHEDALCEAKTSSDSLSRDVWETVSAFANTEGGLIILGLNEKAGFVPVNGFQREAVKQQLIEGMGDGGRDGAKVTNPPRYSVEDATVDGLPVLAVWVEELDPAAKPCYITASGLLNGSYKRVADQDVRLNANEVFSLQNAMSPTNADRAPVVGARIDDLDMGVCEETFARAAELAPRSLQGAETDEDRLRRLNFIDSDGRVTKAGLLSAGKYPQQFFPKLNIDVAVHPGSEKASQSEARFVDRVLCEGTVGEMMESAIAALKRNLRRPYRVQGVGREDDLEIPVEALREAVANALIHRDYDARFDGESIQIDVFDDRVEVLNPGGLWGGLSRRNLDDGISRCRNATLMKLLSIVPLPTSAGSPAEGNGTGILLMKRECANAGIDEPIFCPGVGTFKVIFKRPELSPKGHGRTKSRKDSAGALVSLLDAYGAMSARELSEKSELSINQVRTRLRKLLSDGAIEATASETSRNRKYRIKR